MQRLEFEVNLGLGLPFVFVEFMKLRRDSRIAWGIPKFVLYCSAYIRAPAQGPHVSPCHMETKPEPLNPKQRTHLYGSFNTSGVRSIDPEQNANNLSYQHV